MYMHPQIKEYYGDLVPEISDIRLLDQNSVLGITTLRWREGDKTITIKRVIVDGKAVLIKLD